MVTLRNLEWAAGFLEGEGCFHSSKNGQRIVVTAAQVQREPLDRLKRMFGGTIYGPKPNGERCQPVHTWSAWTRRGAGVMMTLFPLMSPRRKEQIKTALERWRSADGSSRIKVLCHNGHPLSEARVRVLGKHTQRQCRHCQRAYMRARRAKQRAMGIPVQ